MPTTGLAVSAPAKGSSPPAVAAVKPRTPVKPLFQDDPTGDDNAGNRSKRQDAVQCVLDAHAPEALTTPSQRRAATAAQGVVDLTLCGVTDAPLTREQKAAEEAAHAARETAAREAAEQQVQLAARLQAAAKAKAEAEAQQKAAEAARKEAEALRAAEAAKEEAAMLAEPAVDSSHTAAEPPAPTAAAPDTVAERPAPIAAASDTAAPASKPAWQPPVIAASEVAVAEPADPLGATSVGAE